jgi:hypothetical protein
MKLNYYLKEPRSRKATPIVCKVCYSGYVVKAYINEVIKPSYWNKKRQRAIDNKTFPEHPEFNQRLNVVENIIRTEFRRLELDSGLLPPDPTALKSVINAKLKHQRPKAGAKGDFMKFFKKMIDDSKAGVRMNHRTGHAIDPQTIKTYVTTYNNLSKFESARKKPLSFSQFDLNLYNELNEWLLKTLNLSNNSVGKHTQIIKLVLNEATELGINTNLKYKNKRFMVIKEQTDAIYLNAAEIEMIRTLDLRKHPKLEKTRDLFIVGCKTGLRFSDFKQILPSEIKDGYLSLRQAKTGDPVTVPIHPIVQNIIDKYRGQLPKSKVNQVVNRELKEIAKMIPAFHEDVEFVVTKGGKKQVETYKKFELISTHTCRRSFCSNEYLAGTPAMSIMAVSGHKTERAFLRYIKVKSIDHARIIQKIWEEKE